MLYLHVQDEKENPLTEAVATGPDGDQYRANKDGTIHLSESKQYVIQAPGYQPSTVDVMNQTYSEFLTLKKKGETSTNSVKPDKPSMTPWVIVGAGAIALFLIYRN